MLYHWPIGRAEKEEFSPFASVETLWVVSQAGMLFWWVSWEGEPWLGANCRNSMVGGCSLNWEPSDLEHEDQVALLVTRWAERSNAGWSSWVSAESCGGMGEARQGGIWSSTQALWEHTPVLLLLGGAVWVHNKKTIGKSGMVTVCGLRWLQGSQGLCMVGNGSSNELSKKERTGFLKRCYYDISRKVVLDLGEIFVWIFWDSGV